MSSRIGFFSSLRLGDQSMSSDESAGTDDGFAQFLSSQVEKLHSDTAAVQSTSSESYWTVLVLQLILSIAYAVISAWSALTANAVSMALCAILLAIQLPIFLNLAGRCESARKRQLRLAILMIALTPFLLMYALLFSAEPGFVDDIRERQREATLFAGLSLASGLIHTWLVICLERPSTKQAMRH